MCGNTRGMGSGQDAGERERGARDHTVRGKGLTGAEEGTTEGGRRRGAGAREDMILFVQYYIQFKQLQLSYDYYLIL